MDSDLSPAAAARPGAVDNPALVHDWLTGMRGGERCLEVFAELLPEAPIFTLVHEPDRVSEVIESHPIHASPLSRSRFLRRHYRRLLPLFPWAVRRLATREHDLVVSLSHCAAKAARPREGARHICYCFTPARYLWDLRDTYLDPSRSSLPVRTAARAFLPRLQRWDLATAARVDRFIAISDHIADRIRRIYGRESEVIYPPVESERFHPAPPDEVSDRYLMVTALSPYKGVDLAIRAFARGNRKLEIVGRGEDAARLHALAGPNVEFLGWRSDEEVAERMARCRAFLLPCEEDFGITPLEAMASGRPVIALGRGGACETVVPPENEERPATGILFPDPTVESLREALDRLEERLDEFTPEILRARALEFDRSIFRARIARVLHEEGATVAEELESSDRGSRTTA